MGDLGDSSSNHKRKRGGNTKLQHGSRNKRNKAGDLGRKEWSRQAYDRRAQNEASIAKRELIDAEEGRKSMLPAPFPQDEIDAEERKPKHKVAVMIGYSGTGYRGMQINHNEKTIEGDLFTAFVAAGAISKANANDPKKSALVRCARTDKGVHAAGNVISLKLITEDPDIVSKINEHLSPQIRVWGFQRTINSFSCYQACDSRWYEYLIPTHCFVPPHPTSYLGIKLLELATEADDLREYQGRQEEVANFWSEAEEIYIKPILSHLDDSIKADVIKALYEAEKEPEASSHANAIVTEEVENSLYVLPFPGSAKTTSKGESKSPINIKLESSATSRNIRDESTISSSISSQEKENISGKSNLGGDLTNSQETIRKKALDTAIKALRQAYVTAKRSYRISSRRQERVASALLPFLGTQNFHNYTINKSFRDPSAKRNIKSFELNSMPLIINGTEWLSLKIHGQSFMMHQIRKMVSMIALTIRCGCPIVRITETLTAETVSIPKVPGLGLLLERPVFESYNEGAATKFGREKISFDQFEGEMQAFKQREIYERIFREEEQGNAFHTFFNHVDGYRETQFLYLTSKAIAAVKCSPASQSAQDTAIALATMMGSEDEGSSWGNKDEEG